MYNKEVEEIIKLEEDKKIFVIRPSKFINIKHVETNKKIIQDMYDLGVDDAKNKLKLLKKYLKD